MPSVGKVINIQRFKYKHSVLCRGEKLTLVIAGTRLKCVKVTAVELILKGTLRDIGIRERKLTVKIVSVLNLLILT
jgi:hypothetical protein